MARKEDQFLKLLQPYPLRKPPCIFVWWRRSMLKDVAAATGTKHLCPSQQGLQPGAHLRVLIVASPRAGVSASQGRTRVLVGKVWIEERKLRSRQGPGGPGEQRRGGKAPEAAGSGYQMHTQGRRPPVSATERLRDSSRVTQPAIWQRLGAAILIPNGRAHTSSLGSDPWDCGTWNRPSVKRTRLPPTSFETL